MADDWITLAEAFNLMVACEGDVALVERLLLPALWEGKISAVGRRAFIDKHLQNNVSLPTKTDWDGWPENNPVLLYWENSRAISPKGISRTSSLNNSKYHPLIEFYRVEICTSDLKSFWPDIDLDVSKTERAYIPSGLPGRPTSKHLIRAEIERRAAAGETHPTKKAWSISLHEWFVDAYGNESPDASAKTIENIFRDHFAGLLTPKSSKPPK